MRAHALWLFAIGSLLALPARAQDVETLLRDHLREGQRDGLEARLEVGSLDALDHYDLHVAVEDQLRAFGLREIVRVTNDEQRPWRDVALRIYANAVGAAPQVTLLASSCLDGVECRVEVESPSVLRVRLATPLAPGASVRVQLDLQGRLREIDASRTTLAAQGQESLAGMMQPSDGDYGLLARGDGIASFWGFFATRAPRESGAWRVADEGGIGDLGTDRMAMVRARIVVPRDAQIAATGVEVSSLPVRDVPARSLARREVTIHAGLVRDFAFIASLELESIARDVSGVTVRSWAKPRGRDAGRRVLEAASSALELFERRFGAYPYRELDVVEAPLVGGAGGVELSGMVTVASMFYRPSGLGAMMGSGAAADELQTAMLELVTAHEVAHQWWHGIVGSDSRLHPWVDESLAQWSAILWVESRYGVERARMEAERQVAMNYRAMRMMGLEDGAVDRPADAFTPPIVYAGLVYGKGPFLYRALRSELGDERFFAALRAYAERYRFQSAPGRGPIESFARAPHTARVQALARRWLDERHGDEDLGQGDASAMMGAMLPPELRGALESDPALRGMLDSMMRGLMQQGGVDASPADAERVLGEMRRALRGLSGRSGP